MLALVKEPHIRLMMEGEKREMDAFLAFLKSHYTVEIQKTQQDEEEEVMDVRGTELWKSATPGELLAGCRWLHGFTQESLAEKSGIPATSISAYEHGRRRLTMKAAIRLAKAMEVSPSVLFP